MSSTGSNTKTLGRFRNPVPGLEGWERLDWWRSLRSSDSFSAQPTTRCENRSSSPPDTPNPRGCTDRCVGDPAGVGCEHANCRATRLRTVRWPRPPQLGVYPRAALRAATLAKVAAISNPRLWSWWVPWAPAVPSARRTRNAKPATLGTAMPDSRPSPLGQKRI